MEPVHNSEHTSHTSAEMQNLEHIIESYYDTDQNYGEQLLAMKHAHPVFELAIDLQLQAATIRAEANEQELASVLELMKERTDELDKILIDAELYDLPVVLTGDGIIVPNARKMPELNSTIVQSRTDENTKRDLSFGEEIEGILKGFETRIELGQEGETVFIKPVLVYQVAIGEMASPHIMGSICAIGDVGVTQMEFMDDRRNQRVSDLLTVLMDSDDEILVCAIDNLNTLLVSAPQDAAYMRKVGYEVSKILNVIDQSNQQYIDCVIDLIKNYVDINRLYSVGARPILKLPRENEKINGSFELVDDSPYLMITSLMRDLIVMPAYKKSDQELVETKRQALYLATYSNDASWYIKLTDIEVFVPH